ncbi:MAG: hypothetical protein NTY53_17175 [Kiritimatiellaeota bacterium]|nr:hypothetical protein [Kiritimatiellota bacterium]
MVNPRTIISATRTGVYGTLAALFSITDPHSVQILEAAILGCVLADYSTWLMHSLIALPEELWHGTYDAVINTLFGIFLFRFVDTSKVFEGEALGVGFIAFMAIMAIKVVFYAVDYLRDFEEDGI